MAFIKSHSGIFSSPFPASRVTPRHVSKLRRSQREGDGSRSTLRLLSRDFLFRFPRFIYLLLPYQDGKISNHLLRLRIYIFRLKEQRFILWHGVKEIGTRREVLSSRGGDRGGEFIKFPVKSSVKGGFVGEQYLVYNSPP